MRKIWRRSDIDVSKDYVLLLFEDALGVRDFEICESQLIDEKSRDIDYALSTGVVPIDLVLGRDLLAIAEQVMLSNGEPFYFDSHGIWFTKTEIEDIEGNKTPIRWVRGRAPLLPSM